MTKTRSLAVLFAGSFALLVPGLAAQAPQRLTFADTQQRIVWAGPTPAVAWAADGIHIESVVDKAATWWNPATGASQAKPAAPAAASPALVGIQD